MKKSNKIRIGITQGDINGIGYEVILKMLEDPRIAELCTVVVYGSAKIAAYYKKLLDLNNINFVQVASAADAKDGVYSIVNVVGEDVSVEPGVATPASGMAALAALEAATADMRNGIIDALVTAPINKHAIQCETFRFPGHTEYLQACLAVAPNDKALMLMVSDDIRVALVTTHVPLAEVSGLLTKEKVLDTIMSLRRSLRRDFGIEAPRIAVLALNPHGGENGLMGNEEKDIITPAIEEGRQKKALCFGPYPADGFWGSGAFNKFDGIVAMYHDQGLAPFKALAMNEGVNFTAGLPFVRTSPDHGTGYDIAGKGEADCESIRQALYLAIDVVRARDSYDEARANPLRKQYFEKGNDNVVLDLTADEPTTL